MCCLAPWATVLDHVRIPPTIELDRCCCCCLYFELSETATWALVATELSDRFADVADAAAVPFILWRQRSGRVGFSANSIAAWSGERYCDIRRTQLPCQGIVHLALTSELKEKCVETHY